MKIVQSNVKYLDFMAFDHSGYEIMQKFFHIFVPGLEAFIKNIVSEAGLLNENFGGLGLAWCEGKVTAQIDTCITQSDCKTGDHMNLLFPYNF